MDATSSEMKASEAEVAGEDTASLPASRAAGKGVAKSRASRAASKVVAKSRASRSAGRDASKSPASRAIKRSFTGFDLGSVFKFGSAFYLALAAAWLVGSMLLFLVASITGLAGSVEGFVQESGFPEFQLTWFGVFRVLFLLGALSAIVLSALTVLSAYLFNRVADLFGGIEMTFIQDDPEPGGDGRD